MTRFFRLAAVPSLLAATSLGMPQASAASIPVDITRTEQAVDNSWSNDQHNADRHRRYRDYRYRGYRGYRNRVDAGDVLTGVLIIGGIAAIANAAKKDRDRDYRDGDYRYRDRDYRSRDYNYRDRDERNYDYGDSSRGLDRAADICVAEVERNVRVTDIESVERDSDGWEVEGRLAGGEEFKCKLDRNGNISELDVETDGGDYDYERENDYLDDGFASASPAPGQLSDERYAEARRGLTVEPDAALQPAYPGGPLPGDEEL